MSETTEERIPVKWQPIMLIVSPDRVECTCGAMAIFIVGDKSQDGDKTLVNVEYYCQECFRQAQERERDE